MRYQTGLLAALVGIMLFSGVATAATRYVSDELSINMRRGPGTGYRISELVKAGDRLTTLSEANGWTQVRTSDGTTGYVLTRFLSDEPAARTRIAAMQEQTEKFKQENEQLKEQLAEVRSGSQELTETKSTLENENQELSQRLQQLRETSADAVRISNENEKYREELLSMRSDNERLRHENAGLQSRRDGMKIGALILIGGVIIGLVLPLFRRQKKGSSWDSL
ncbi:TIGR04211 family SH3 domain-containing protein [uncultured Salinisphaera sp.]|jgi:SH3 domain protein|uniref:TIGR04211 family SH3 domain-containing protein n=1 Tax=uncultured Salinisphaera sp. TaxID=359372 RepID=UPI0032B185B4|tara:strand:- start:593 stop:1261 length:669 start_codon:yes stop_codon:yes gene_type:complete